MANLKTILNVNSVIEIGCFGKLPVYEEFIRHNADGPEVHFLEKWLQEGVNLLKSGNREGWNDYYNSIPKYYFMLQLKDHKRLLLGVVMQSKDKGGREYPFVIFLSINHRRFNYHLIFLPVIFASVLAKASKLISGDWKNENVDRFVTQVDQLSAALPAEPKTSQQAFVDYLARETNESFWSSLFGSFSDPRKYLVYQNLRQILLPLRQRNIQKFSMGLKFPLISENDPDAFEVTFWLYVTGKMLGRSIGSPFMFWNRESQNGHEGMLLFLQPPMPDSFLYLVRPDLEDEKLCVLHRDGVAKPEDLDPAFRKLMDSPKLTLAEILKTIE